MRRAADLEGLLDIVALEVLRGVAGDGDVVVVDHQLHVDVTGSSKARGLGVVALLLRTIRAQAPRNLVRVGHGHTIHHRPHLCKKK